MIRNALAGILAGLITASAAHAATPTQTVGAQFRHAAIHRLSAAADTPATSITTACLARPRRVYSCSAVAWDQYHLPAMVFEFRFTTAAGVSGYYGPSGPRWKTRLPYGKRNHRHLEGRITRVSIGPPMIEPAG